MNASEVFVKALENEGVECIFAVPGFMADIQGRWFVLSE